MDIRNLGPSRIKAALQDRNVVRQAKQLQHAMAHSASIMQINGILIKVLKSTWKELEKNGVNQVSYKWKGKKQIAKFKQEIKEFEDIIKEGYAESD